MPPRDVTTILPQEVKDQLLSVPGQLREAREWCALCQAAGLDMSEHDRKAQELERLANGLIRTFVDPRRRR